MRKTIVILFTALLCLAAIATAQASEKKASKPKKQPQQGVTLSQEQFMQMLSMIIAQPTATPTTSIPGSPGKTGDKGDRGDTGSTGATGPAGATGERGADGAAGRDGAPGRDGRDGVGFAQGVVFLVNGACPPGSTVQGPQNRWTVYANDTSGRPWTTTGSSAQLFLSACQVD
jgi:hypothetical protein